MDDTTITNTNDNDIYTANPHVLALVTLVIGIIAGSPIVIGAPIIWYLLDQFDFRLDSIEFYRVLSQRMKDYFQGTIEGTYEVLNLERQPALEQPPPQAQPKPELAPEPSTSGVTPFENIEVDLNVTVHGLVVAKTGFGKSTTVFNLIDRINHTYDARFIVCELGGIDWTQALATEPVPIGRVVLQLAQIMVNRQRQMAASGHRHIDETNLPRIVAIFEEMESTLQIFQSYKFKISAFEFPFSIIEMLSSITGIPVTAVADLSFYDAVTMCLANTARLGRKTGVHSIVATQNAYADILPSAYRNMLELRFVGRTERVNARVLGCTEDVSLLPPGVFWYKQTNGLVRFPMMETCPDVPFISRRELNALARIGGLEDIDTTGIDEPDIVHDNTTDTSIDTGIHQRDSAISSESIPVSKLTERQRIIYHGLRHGMSANEIYAALGGNRNDVLAAIREVKEIFDG